MARARRIAGYGLLALAAANAGRPALAQTASLADDIIVISKGARGKEEARTNTPLGSTPGAGHNPFRPPPGSGHPVLEERTVPGGPSFRPASGRGILSAAATAEGDEAPRPGAGGEGILPPERLRPAEVPLYGPLDLPDVMDPGPAGGMTLDMAIDRLLHASPDLRSKSHEIPQAQADILSAGLRANPIVFASADNVPYGDYSKARPGSNDYTFVLIQPFDVNGKRRARMVVARQAKRVLEAQFQDAVRLEIDNLYTAFVDVLEARDDVRFARAGLAGLDRMLEATRRLVERGDREHPEVDRVSIQRDAAAIGVEEAEGALARAKQSLAVLLGIPDEQVDRLEVRGALHDDAAAPPPVEVLIQAARCNRPDLASYRLGVGRAQADVKLARAERFEDVFLLYTPYTTTNNHPEGGQNANSWSVGGVVSIPLFNRNQGNIARAQSNVAQTRAELAQLERQVVAEVRRARIRYDVTRGAIARLEREILPKSRHLRDESARSFARKGGDPVGYLSAERDYNEVVRQYRDALTRHRRSTLQLNTAVGLRLLP